MRLGDTHAYILNFSLHHNSCKLGGGVVHREAQLEPNQLVDTIMNKLLNKDIVIDRSKSFSLISEV